MAHRSIRLYAFHHWANRRVMDHLKELPEAIYTKEIQSVFPSLSDVLTHMLVTDHIWYGVMTEQGFDQIVKTADRVRGEIDGMSLKALEKKYFELHQEYEKLLNAQDDLDRQMNVEHPKFGKLDATFADLVQHVVNHGTYHRGNISAMLHQLGHKGVPTDYVYYLYTLEKQV